MTDDPAPDRALGLPNPRTVLLVAAAVAVAVAIAVLSLDDDEFPDDDPVEIDV